MAIQQAIYTHTKVRRDTRSTGFGYYSMTAGMERLLDENRSLAAASMNYISPRNSELWWETEQQDIFMRDLLEAQRIKEHHPEAFGYRLFDTSEGRIAALTYGKNLGRDLSPLTRDGNILVNTLTAGLDEIDRYPYEYCGSPALFLGCGRDFFMNAGDEPAADLPEPPDIPPGNEAPDPEAVAQFLAEDDRLSILRRMLGALMRINDGSPLKRIMICDSKENIIYWIAALSLIYPVEAAKELSFSTYSFLGGNPDDFAPFYDDVMITGVYTPTVNGDPDSKRTTNYDPQREKENPETALFDMELGIYPDDEDEHPYFGVFIESAFETDLRLLDNYKEFITERTSCRSLGSAYAEGYGYYTITRLKNEYSLRYISDAAAFAKSYMDADAMKELLGIAFGCGFASEEAGELFGGVLHAASGAVKGGYISPEQLAESSVGCLLNSFRDEETVRGAYYGLKKQLSGALGKQGISLEKAFIDRLSLAELENYCTAHCKRWRLAELAGMISRIVSKEPKAERFGSGGLEKIFLRLSRRLIISEKNDRGGLIDALLDGFGRETAARCFCEIYRMLHDRPDIKAELRGSFPEQMLKTRGIGLTELIDLADREGILDDALDAAVDTAESRLVAAERAELYAEIIKAGNGRLDDRFDSFMNSLRSDSGETSPEEIYALYEFAAKTGRPEKADTAGLVREYFDAAAAVSGRYSIDDETGIRLLEMTAASPDPGEILGSDPELASAESLIFIKVFADVRDKEDMYPDPDLLPYIDFGDMTETERNESVREAGNAFARRSMALHSALDVGYRYFIDTEDRRSDRVIADIFAAWAEELAVIRPADYLRLIGQVIALSSPFMRDGLAFGNMLYERHITPDEIRPYVFDKECLANIGGAIDRLRRLADDMTEVYENRSGRSPFGKIRSKLGNSKKNKK